MSEPEHHGASFYLGVGMAVAGNTLIACSLTLQKHVHNKKTALKPVGKDPLFYFALGGMIAGEVGNFAAFGFASPTVISPLGAVSVIANAILAVVFLRESLYTRSLLGLALTLLGTAVVVYHAPPTVENLPIEELGSLLKKPAAIVYLSVVTTAVLVLGAMERAGWGRKLLLVNLMLCSLLGSITVLCSSVSSKILKSIANGEASPRTVMTSPTPYIVLPTLAFTAVMQLKFLNKAMEAFDSTQVVPVYYVTFTCASISAGGFVFGDFWRFTAANGLLFLLGCLLCFLGVFLISSRPRSTGRAGRDRSGRGPASAPEFERYGRHGELTSTTAAAAAAFDEEAAARAGMSAAMSEAGVLEPSPGLRPPTLAGHLSISGSPHASLSTDALQAVEAAGGTPARPTSPHSPHGRGGADPARDSSMARAWHVLTGQLDHELLSWPALPPADAGADSPTQTEAEVGDLADLAEPFSVVTGVSTMSQIQRAIGTPARQAARFRRMNEPIDPPTGLPRRALLAGASCPPLAAAAPAHTPAGTLVAGRRSEAAEPPRTPASPPRTPASPMEHSAEGLSAGLLGASHGALSAPMTPTAVVSGVRPGGSRSAPASAGRACAARGVPGAAPAESETDSTTDYVAPEPPPRTRSPQQDAE